MATSLHRHALPTLLLLLHLTLSACEIHRAKHQRAFPRTGEPPAPQAGPMATLQELYIRHEPWVLSVVGAALVGFSGILPLLVIPLETGARLKERDGEKRLRVLLSFAVGGLLGDVFLHLLPEAMEHAQNPRDQIKVGMWVIGGVFFFLLLEMLFSQTLSDEEEPEREREPEPAEQQPVANGAAGELRRRQVGEHTSLNGVVKGAAVPPPQPQPPRPPTKQAAGYLNLLANSVDNFTHGLAIGGSFLASTRIGLLTTFAILIHEIPHEVGDFAILLKSGFSRWEAAKAQLATATLGITGAISALLADDPRALGDRTAWILPFTAGGFIHIALVSVLPEVCKEREPRQCLKQVFSMTAGVLIMLTVTVAFEH